jgi:hypothetical protein
MILYAPTPEGKSKIREEVSRLADLGLTIIPIRCGSKLPAVRWKSYQFRTPSRSTATRWYRRADIGGLAVIHGRASYGLACRDFDEPGAYDRWASAHKSLAVSLPTSVSHRGPKVYFITVDELYRKLSDGELIGDSKHYSCLPPTIHPTTNKPYEWVVPFVTLPPILDPVEAGFLPAELEHNDNPIPIPNVSRETQR